jgi:hypothetical protein
MYTGFALIVIFYLLAEILLQNSRANDCGDC